VEGGIFWLLGLALTASLIGVARRVAPAIGLVDRPSRRKSHRGDVPLVGGIAIYVGLVVTITVAGQLAESTAFLTAGLLLLAVGLWDDLRRSSPGIRITLQAVAVLIVGYFGDAFLWSLGGIGPGGTELQLGWLAVPFTVFAGVGLINAFNMADGLDGLCGTLVLAALVGLGLVALYGGRPQESALILLLTGCVAAFLAYNLRLPGRDQAKVFLGDAGSYLLGFSVLYLATKLSQGPERVMSPVSALWFCMLPLLDTIGMIIRRLRRRRSPFAADREHLHHVFLLAKFSVSETVMVMATMALIGVFVGLVPVITGVSDTALFAGFLVMSALYYWMIVRAWTVMRFLSRSINRRLEPIDRRHGAERRQRKDANVVAIVGKERRSGVDRRQGTNGRRHDELEFDDPPTTLPRPRPASGSQAVRAPHTSASTH